MAKTGLVVSAHPGDFVWRAGGAIALHAKRGYLVKIVCLAFGERGESQFAWKQPGMTLEKVKAPTPDRKEVTAYRFRFKAEQRGDYTFVLQTPPIWLEEDQEFVQDTVKVVLHVQAQKHWDAAAGADYEFLPLTRPYGLQPGMVFQAQLRGREVERVPPLQAQPGALVEVERYNPTAPAELPPDEQITRTAKTGPTGVVTATLPEAGWWCLTASRRNGRAEHEGKAYPLRQRTTFWVFVDGKATK